MQNRLSWLQLSFHTRMAEMGAGLLCAFLATLTLRTPGDEENLWAIERRYDATGRAAKAKAAGG